MLKALKISFLVFVCSALLACSKSPEEKAKDNVAQYNSLVQELNGSMPSDSWTDQELITYERKLDRLEQLEVALDSANGNDGVVIYGGNNHVFVAQRRSMIASIRARKTARTQNQEPNRPRAEPEKSDESTIEEMQQLNDDIRTLAIERLGLGIPDSTWSIKRLTSYKDLTVTIIENFEKMIDLAYELPATAKRTEAISQVSELKYKYEIDLGDVNQLLSDKAPRETDRR